ncbi:MAG: SDR family NAD(P)-dependent oxidoreductase [Myxococcales bacterium]|nr:SDR family NAD(P)-dependent oxidoreductase [Myxococcales bacterium]
MQITSKVFVVTGAGSGMGRELTRQLLAKGAKVAAVDLRRATLDELAAALGEDGTRLSTHAVDVSDRQAVYALPGAVVEHHGQVDGVFNNAGIIQPFVTLDELDFDTIDRVLRVNLMGTIYVDKAFLPWLLQRPEAHLANFSSMGGFLPVPGQAIYGASKAAVKLMSEALYAELLETSVRVSVVFPGAIATNIVDNSKVKMPELAGKGPSIPMLPAEEAARQIIAGVERNRLRILVGRDARLMDKLYRLAPERAVRLIQRQMRALL